MDNVIEITGLTKTFPEFSLGPLDLAVPKGAIYGFIGANGAGKTTTIDLMMGMGAPNAGSIRIFGLDHAKDEVAIKRRTGYFGMDTRYDAWGLVGHVVRFWQKWYPTWDQGYSTSLQERFGLKDSDQIATLSFGARTKLGLLLALSHHPDLLLLDEPFTGLDAPAKREVLHELLEAVKNPERTVFISSHHLDEIERFADYLGVLKDGKLILSGPTDLLIERFCAVAYHADNGFNPTTLNGVHVDRCNGADYTLIVDQSTEALDQLGSRSGQPLQTTPVTLEDLCAVLLKKGVNK